MSLQSGATLGPYQILAPLGAGGMGEVYRAKDTRLQPKSRALNTLDCLSLTVILAHLCFAGCASTPRLAPAGAEVAPTEEAAILDAVGRALQAVGARDTAAYSELLISDGMTYRQKLVDGQWHLLRRTNQHDIDTLADGTEVLHETYWEPTVLIRGPIAVVWAPYEFRRDGKVSHCGVDVFNMLKVDGRWLIGNAMWTVEPEACDELKPRRGDRKSLVELQYP